ncbi:hypothetical protein ACH5RR_015988 [Cinchona calisaya]|uniref:Uncharacterized protein n=1 Tax=Cinchona calisaya TaxID=153742 RepID=A0ABD2ZUR2_9GENT
MLVKNGGEACNASLDFFEGIKISEIAHIGDIFIYPSDSLINFVLPPTPSIGKNKRDSAQISGQVPTLISLETLKGALIYRNRGTVVLKALKSRRILHFFGNKYGI